jgi:hypothetical protein
VTPPPFSAPPSSVRRPAAPAMFHRYATPCISRTTCQVHARVKKVSWNPNIVTHTFEVTTPMRKKRRWKQPMATQPHELPSDSPAVEFPRVPRALREWVASTLLFRTTAEALCRAEARAKSVAHSIEGDHVPFAPPLVWTKHHCYSFDLGADGVSCEKLCRDVALERFGSTLAKFRNLGKPKHLPEGAMPSPRTAMPCKRRVCHSHPIRSRLMDTGCGFDLVQKSSVTSREDCFQPLVNPFLEYRQWRD